MAPQPQQQQLDERSILAARYVPKDLRAINSIQVTTPLTAAKIHPLNCAKLHQSLVPPIPTCRCNEQHSSTSNVPIRKVSLELRYALPPVITSKPGIPWPTVNGIGDIEEYCKTFEKLLWEERSVVLLLYEKYSQYNIPLSVSQGHSNGSLVATFRLNGISDARPPLQTGDTILLRPMRLLSLPVLMPQNHLFTWSPAHHSVEIDAQVLKTIRTDKSPHQKKKKNLDIVMTTWLDPVSNHTLQQSYVLQRFNVRFIPCVKLYERCLIALDWLKSVSSTHHTKLMLELLFPNTAPILPPLKEKANYDKLNDRQCKFVDMVLLRTRHPSTESVRPPMLLTGPAGTGKSVSACDGVLLDMSQFTHPKLLCSIDRRP